MATIIGDARWACTSGELIIYRPSRMTAGTHPDSALIGMVGRPSQVVMHAEASFVQESQPPAVASAATRKSLSDQAALRGLPS
ncbi:MAG: hypothetical protein QG597_3114 [Actinomycetota bacterium]|nr:hypothetical protein [Actinomycetota bacterium]